MRKEYLLNTCLENCPKVPLRPSQGLVSRLSRLILQSVLWCFTRMSLQQPRIVGHAPPELLVYDEPTECPYLDDRIARFPMRLPARALRREEFAERLKIGDRRQGLILYRPSCPSCGACEPIRIQINEFQANRSQRRALRRGLQLLTTDIGRPDVDDTRIDLYNRHKIKRGLLGNSEHIDISGYRSFLVDTCTDTFELRYYLDNRLVGVAIADRAQDALSAVYTYFDPDLQHLSLGTFSIMVQIELCRQWSLQFLYLGLYVQGCDAMTYKSRYFPHERRIAGMWQRFDRNKSDQSL